MDFDYSACYTSFLSNFDRKKSIKANLYHAQWRDNFDPTENDYSHLTIF